MTFKEAGETEIQFGKHKGETIDEVAKTDEGLCYLDWLFGHKKLYGPIRDAIAIYLSDSMIKKELERILEE